ncbi:MAG: hydrogenase nickel incorporation protein HypB [Syntrophobacter sp.]
MTKADSAKSPIETREEYAAGNKRLMEENGVAMVNLIGQPGAGKTTVLEKILPLLKNKLSFAVIEGDRAGLHSDSRLAASGAEVIRIHTRGSFDLDIVQVNEALRKLPLENLDVVVVENIGNPDCPEELDLGDDLKIFVTSVTDGMDVPARYSRDFKQASVALVNKIDLLPYREFSLGAFIEELVSINESLKIFPISALTGEGMEELSISLGRMVWKRRRNLAA